jgi:PadR family transcriptional regulator, regulatory protein AphA
MPHAAACSPPDIGRERSRMALSHAILVSLLDRPQTGYELNKRFDQTVGFFWKASHQQIYQELHKMAAARWVKSATVEQADRPNRIVYEITDAGCAVVDDWIGKPTDPPSVKEELLVKLFAMPAADAPTLVREIERRLAFHQERLAWYESLMKEHYPQPAKLPPRKRGRYLGLRMGVMSEQTTIDWCVEALALLKGR